jgi:hypothetical protein
MPPWPRVDMSHLTDRIRERFGVEVLPREVAALRDSIQSGEARRIAVQETGREVYAVVVAGLAINAVWDPDRLRVVTVLPPEWRVAITQRRDGERRKRGNRRYLR